MPYITIDRAAIIRNTEKAIMIELPKGWSFWHPLSAAYRHPVTPSKILLACLNNNGPICRNKDRKAKPDRIVEWRHIANANGGFYTGQTATLAPFTLRDAERGKYTPQHPAPMPAPDHVEPLLYLTRATSKLATAARPLTADQRAAVAQFQNLTVGALFMACGTGKTQTVTAIANTLNVDRLLWLCPCRVIDNTREELKKCGLIHTPLILGIESMSASKTAFPRAMEFLTAVHPIRAAIIVDESLTIKNAASKRTQRILELGKYARYKFILNGTPITRNVLDIYAQMQFLSPDILGCSLTEFKHRYAVTQLKKLQGRVCEKIIGAANMEHLLAITSPYTFTCSLQLDVQKEYYTHHVQLTTEEMNGYQREKHELILAYKRGEETNMGAVFAKLMHRYSLAKAKLCKLKELLKGKESRTIIFCRFIATAEALQAYANGAKILTYGKGSIGLNLQAYNRIVYFDKTWDYAFREQSEARIFRTGQTSTCEYHDITLNTGIDKLIDQCIAKKANLLDIAMRRTDILEHL